MVGSIADFVCRMRRVLPTRWFADSAPALEEVLSGFGVAWAGIYNLVEAVRAQARLATSSGCFVDLISVDFFGAGLKRRSGEGDAVFGTRIGKELLRSRATRQALLQAMYDLTGQQAAIFEPVRPRDTGGYSAGGVGYGCAGGYGNLALPFQSFLTVRRPHGGGIAALAGYGTGGVLGRGSLALVRTQVSDAEIYRVAQSIVPAGYRLWVQITN